MILKTVAAIALLLPTPALAQYGVFGKPRPYSMEVLYTTYSDIVKNASNPQDELASTISINANIRVYRIFSLMASYGTSVDDEWSYYGLGFKIDLPGFFFIGGLTNDLVHTRKNRGVNSYVSFGKYSATQVGLGDSFVNDRLSYGLDIFLGGDLYMNIDLGILSHQGNQFLAPAVGLGYEF